MSKSTEQTCIILSTTDNLKLYTYSMIFSNIYHQTFQLST